MSKAYDVKARIVVYGTGVVCARDETEVEELIRDNVELLDIDWPTADIEVEISEMDAADEPPLP